MAEFVEVINQRERMCASYKNCDMCPINKVSPMSDCLSWMSTYPKEGEKLIMAWAKEHPLKTNKDKFIEVFGVLDIYRIDSNWWDKEYKAPTEESK